MSLGQVLYLSETLLRLATSRPQYLLSGIPHIHD